MQIDVGSSGTNANIPFSGWAISDVANYRGCGTFEKYSITANASTLALLQYPEPGKTLSVDCTLISQCLNVRVIDTSAPKIIRFSLHINPVVGQDTVSVPFVIDLTPCRTATLTIPVNPSDLTIDRTNTIGNSVNYLIDTTYKSFIVNSQNTYCPFLSYDLLDTSGNILNSEYVQMTDKKSPAATKLVVKNDVPFTLTVRIQAATMSKSNYAPLLIRVCGTETLTLVNSAKRTFVVGQV